MKSIKPGRYKHFKGGEYIVAGSAVCKTDGWGRNKAFCVAKNSENHETSFNVYKVTRKGFDFYFVDAIDGREWVLYQATYGDKGWWIRPYDMFLEKVVKLEIGYSGPRFAFMRNA